MNLQDFFPEKPQLKLKGKTYDFRIPNIEDRATFHRICGGEDGMKNAFNKKLWPEICKIAYVLLVQKDEFPGDETEHEERDENGFKRKVQLTGPLKFLRAFESQQDLAALMGALTMAFAAGEPLLKPVIDREIKKKQAELAMLNPIGENSSSGAPETTDTPPSNSENLPSAS